MWVWSMRSKRGSKKVWVKVCLEWIGDVANCKGVLVGRGTGDI